MKLLSYAFLLAPIFSSMYASEKEESWDPSNGGVTIDYSIVKHKQLIEAARAGDQFRVANLLKQHADPSLTINDECALHAAVEQAGSSGNGTIVRMLLENKAVVDAAHPKNGKTALIYAAIANNRDVARLLMQAGADRYWMDNQSKTAEEYATDPELKKLVRLVRAGGKDNQ